MARGRKHIKKRRKDRKYLSMKQEIEREEELEAEKLAMDLRNSVVNGGLAVNKDIKNTIRDIDTDGIIISNKNNTVHTLKGLDKDSEFGSQAGIELMTEDNKEDSVIDKRIDSLIDGLDEKLSNIDEKPVKNDKIVLETGEITEVVGGSQKSQEVRRDDLEGPGVISKEVVKSSQKARMALSEVFWNVFIVVATIFMILGIFMMWLLFKTLFG